MKRKLNEHDVPEAVLPEEVEEDDSAAPTSFDRFAIDARLLQAIAAEKYAVPTPVQAKAIPLALDGRDILGMCNSSAHGRSLLTWHSTSEDWVRENCRVYPSNSAIHSEAEGIDKSNTKLYSNHPRANKGIGQSSHPISRSTLGLLCERRTRREPHPSNF